MKVLVCDSDRAEGARVRRQIEALGAEVFSAYDVAETLRQVKAHWPDLVIFEARLGLDAVREIRALPPWFEPTYVIVVNGGGDEEVFEGYHGGADMVLPRPLDVAEIAPGLRSRD